MLYLAFPKKCDELLSGWNNDSGSYKFICWKCKSIVEAPKFLENGDPCNIALGTHWDGFNVSSKKKQGCWTMEINVLNAGTSSNISLLRILFIPFGGHETYIVEQMKHNIFAFIQPFVEELESLFMQGINCRYNYPC